MPVHICYGRKITVVGGSASVHKWSEEHSLQALSAYIASSGADEFWWIPKQSHVSSIGNAHPVTFIEFYK